MVLFVAGSFVDSCTLARASRVRQESGSAGFSQQQFRITGSVRCLYTYIHIIYIYIYIYT